MELITNEIRERFEKHPYASQDGKWLDSEVLVKYFNPVGAGTWIITEAEFEDGDWCLFGFCSLGFGYEFGPVMLSELQNLRLPLGMRVERDLHLKDHCRVSDLISADELM